MKLKELLTEAAPESDDHKAALAKYFEVDEEAVEKVSGEYEVNGKASYVVYTEEEAYEEAVERSLELLDDMGPSTLTPEAKNEIASKDYIKSGESNKEDFLEIKKGAKGDAEKMVAGMEDKNLFDLEKVAEYMVDMDGPEHTLASYDGEEISLDGGLVAYCTDKQ